jgi:Tol biopolymer transport system component
MPDVQEVFRMATQKVRPDEGFVDRQLDHQRRRARNRRNGAIALVAVIGVVAVVFAVRLAGGEDRSQPAIQPTPPAVLPEVDHLLDLDTGMMTPLPNAIVGETDVMEYPAISPDGSKMAYVAPGDDGNLQIFVANLDGTQVRQLTHDDEAYAPAWSPDGTQVAYEAYGDGFVHNLFVVDLATGEATQVTDFEVAQAFGTQFSPDGSSLVYAGGDEGEGVRLAPIAGGSHTLLVGGGKGRGDAGNGSLSPDGSLLAYAFTEGPDDFSPELWVANADGSDPRPLVEEGGLPIDCFSVPAGTWSPDGTRVTCSDGTDVFVIDVATGETTAVAEGENAIWLDDHTLLIDV